MSPQYDSDNEITHRLLLQLNKLVGIDKSQNVKHWCIMADFKLLTLLFIKNIVDVAQNLQGLSYRVCSTNIATIFRTRISYSSFWEMLQYTPTAFCYVDEDYEIRL